MLRTSLCLIVLLSIGMINSLYAQEAQHPIVKDFGGIYEIENSINPDPDLEYKIVVDLKTLQSNKKVINPGLNNVARMMNLHGLGGVKAENLKVVVVVHGSATETILNDERYYRKNNTDNPNLELIDALTEAGAGFYVCGQSLLARNYKQEEVNTKVKTGLSMLTVVTTHLHNGYHLLVFD